MPRFDFQEIVERLPLVVYIDNLDEQSSPLYVSPEMALDRLREYYRSIGSELDLGEEPGAASSRDWAYSRFASSA